MKERERKGKKEGDKERMLNLTGQSQQAEISGTTYLVWTESSPQEPPTHTTHRLSHTHAYTHSYTLWGVISVSVAAHRAFTAYLILVNYAWSTLASFRKRGMDSLLHLTV